MKYFASGGKMNLVQSMKNTTVNITTKYLNIKYFYSILRWTVILHNSADRIWMGIHQAYFVQQREESLHDHSTTSSSCQCRLHHCRGMKLTNCNYKFSLIKRNALNKDYSFHQGTKVHKNIYIFFLMYLYSYIQLNCNMIM